MIKHLLTDIGNNTLTDPRHQVEARKGANRKGQHQQQEQPDRLIQQCWRLRHEALVNHQANPLPHRQGNRRRQH